MPDDVVDLAGELGRRMAADPRTAALKAATAAALADPEAMRVQEEYSRALGAVRAQEEAGKPIEPDQKRRLALLADCVRLSPPLQRLLRAQQEFGEMWEDIQRAIGEPVDALLAPPEPAEPSRIIRPS